MQVEELLQSGADPSSSDGAHTALHRAVERGHFDVVTLLLNAAADVNLPASDGDLVGFAPLHIAARNGHDSVVETLLKAEGCDVNAMDKVRI